MRPSRTRISVCSTPGCPALTEGRFCPDHRQAPPDKRPSAHRRGYDAQWRKTRAQFLKTHPTCQDASGCLKPATDVDHIDGLGPNGPRGYDWSNLRSLCHSHHSQRTARDQPGGWNPGKRGTDRFTIIAGPSGVGKSTIRGTLASKLHAVALGPDDFDNGWATVYQILDRSDAAVVECVRIPYGLRRRMTDRGATIVLLTAPDSVRRERLEQRGEPPDQLEDMLVWSGSLGYEDHVEPDMTIETTRDPDQIAAELADKLRSPEFTS